MEKTPCLLEFGSLWANWANLVSSLLQGSSFSDRRQLANLKQDSFQNYVKQARQRLLTSLYPYVDILFGHLVS